MAEGQELHGKRVALIVTDYGVEEAELARPRQAVLEAGGEAVVVTTGGTEIRSLIGDKDPGRTFTADLALSDADPAAFDAVIVPGGTINADNLRLVEDGIAFVDAFVSAGKPVAAICHGPWTLIETGRLGGKTLTSYWSLQTDVTNAGATWVDESVHVDPSSGWTLVTSRNPDDLDDFSREMVAAFAD